MDAPWWLLVLAGVGAGLCGSVAGLASVVSYPALLAAGLSPVSANVTSTVAMTSNTAGSGLAARRELRGQGPLVLRLCAVTALGGCLGAALLLTTPTSVFEVLVPWLVALGGVSLLARDRLRVLLARRSPRGSRAGGAVRWWVLFLGIGLYGGYFGAGAGILLLAAMSLRYDFALPVTNAVKNLGSGAANVSSALIYAVAGPVDWPVAGLLAAGALVGGLAGPRVLRAVPERPLRYAIGAAGIGLAVHLLAG
ncbi:sulfite exporter TauE/SafE family protein [Nocardioides sp. 503]|uniref:sulfite exporter TauE/SafE family protein n=1 Tax=Nocardioides sp. 503 TaxID=2508326 RepID=UPI0010701C15|nr:sulfite exporter TauE/SafE family protein [Nocardioides sp. 503]